MERDIALMIAAPEQKAVPTWLTMSGMLWYIFTNLTYLSTCREAHLAEKYEGYFDFKQLKICVHVNIYSSSI
jgi:hypothetical protein